MKMGLKYAAHIWSYHVLLMVIALFFLSGMGSAWYAIVLDVLLIAGITLMAFNDGAYNGEKACTLAVSLEKQVKEGRRVDEKLKAQVFNKKVAVWILIFGMVPFLLMSTVNAIVAPFYPEAQTAAEVAEEDTTGSFDFEYDEEAAAEEIAQINKVNVVARMVFMPYVSFYGLVRGNVLNALFFLFSLPMPIAEAVGYLLGPKMREKKLKDIARGKKRKMRNLKVHKKPRQPKAEV